jgi:hypothetical protein
VHRDGHWVAVVLAQGADILDLHRIGDQVRVGEGRHTRNRLGANSYQFGGEGAWPHGGGAGALAGRVVDLNIHKEHIAQVHDPNEQ